MSALKREGEDMCVGLEEGTGGYVCRPFEKGREGYVCRP